MIQVLVQRRLPTYDVLIRTSHDCVFVRNRLVALFEESRKPLRGLVLFDLRVQGSFDGENSFVARSSREMTSYNAPAPTLDGYILPNESGGCDVLIRATYPSYWWKIDAFLSAAFLMMAGFHEPLMLPFLAVMLAAITFLPLWAAGSSFANRLEKLLG